MRLFILIIAVAAAGLVIYDGAVLLLAALRSNAVSAQSEAFTAEPRAEGAGSILVVGDSTAVGTGAERPQCSLAGRLAADFPRFGVVHRGVNGAVTREVLAQMRRKPHSSYDLVLVQTGGNDVLRFTALGALRRQLTELLSAARDSADHVVLMSVGNLGEAPAIPWPLSELYAWRSRQVRDLFSEVASEMDIAYVDLFSPAGQQTPFQAEPQRYYARDGLHPSGAGYGIWYDSLRGTQPLETWLGPAQDGKSRPENRQSDAAGSCPG